jgi:hypothetical protein
MPSGCFYLTVEDFLMFGWFKKIHKRIKAILAYRKLHKERNWYARMGREQDEGIESYD